MKPDLSDKELYEIAKERVERKRSFKIHLSCYLIFVLATIINVITNGFDFNNIMPALGWGIGVIVHFMSVYNMLNSDEAIQKEIDKMKK